MERNTRITLEVTHVFTQIISENISLSYGIIFQAPEQNKDALSKKAVGCQAIYWVILVTEVHIRRRRHQIKQRDIP